MSYRPTVMPSMRGSSLDERSIGNRVRLLTQVNPWMAQRVDVLETMATSPLDNDTLMSTAAQQYGMMVGNDLAGQLKGMNAAGQRAILSQMSPQQQAALAQMGYSAPQRETEDGLFGDVIRPIAGAASFIGNGLAQIPGVSEVGSATLEGLTWVGNWPGHVYRTVRSLDDTGQMGGLIGAVVGAGAVLLAIPTGGSSLMALGALGLGAVGGAAAGSFTASLSNPDDWMRAFNTTWDGEKSFDRPSVRKASELLLDGRMRGLATDLANEDLDIVELAREMAGTGEPSMNTQLAKVEQLAAKMAERGTTEYEAAVNAMLNAVQEPTFQQAIQTLVSGKMSPGRDLADVLALDPDSSLYNWVSGATDAVFTVAVDPTLMLGKANQFVKAQRYTMRVFDGAEAATEFAKIAARPGVLRFHEGIADAVSKADRGGLALMRSLNPTGDRLYVDLVEHAKGLVATGNLSSVSEFTVKDMHEYFKTWTNLEPVLRGMGTVANSKGLQLLSQSRMVSEFRQVRQATRAFTSGLSDASTQHRIMEEVSQHPEALRDMVPPSYFDIVTEEGVIDKPWRANQAMPGVYEAGLAAGNIPVVGRIAGKLGDIMTSATTMALSGKQISLTGERAARDIRALSEMGRYTGMPSWARQAWADAILSSDSVGTRMNAAHGWLTNIVRLAGADTTEDGAQFIDDFLNKARQVYGSAGDTITINGRQIHAGLFLNDQATMMVMPDISELRKATDNAFVARHVMGIVEHPMVESLMTKIWKPAILLRLGFIPRAAGEELAGFLARGGMGSLLQESGSRFLGRIHAYEEATRMVGAGIKPTIDQVAMLDKGLTAIIPAHMRPVMRMAERLGFGSPTEHVLLNYTRWLATRLQDGAGVLDDIDKSMAKFAGQALDAARSPADPRWLPAQAKSFNPMKLNATDYANSILLGNTYSLRRMMLGGVDDELVLAGTEWARKHSTTIMREVSAVNAGPVEQGIEAADVHTVMVQKHGKLRRERQISVKGERRMVGYNDPMFRNGVHDQVRRTLDDDFGRRLLETHLSRVRAGTGVSQEELGDAATVLMNMGRFEGTPINVTDRVNYHSSRILLEFLDPFDHDKWRATVSQLRRHPDGAVIADALDALPETDLLRIDNVIQRLDEHSYDLTLDDFGGKLEKYNHAKRQLGNVKRALQRDAKPMVEWLEALPRGDRSFVAQFLHQQAIGGERAFWPQYLAREKAARAAHALGGADQAAVNAENAARRAAAQQEYHAALDAYDPADVTAMAPMYLEPELLPPVVVAPYQPTKWLYDDLNEARDAGVAELRAAMLDPNLQPKVSKAMRGMERDAQGEVIGTELHAGTVMLYEVKAPKMLTFEQLRANSARPELLDQNELIVRQIIARQKEGTALVANFELAQEISRARTASAGIDPSVAERPKMLRQMRQVTDGRVHDVLIPDTATKLDGKAQLWHYPPDAAAARLQPTPDGALDPVEQWATDAWNQLTFNLSKRPHHQVKARTRVVQRMEDGTLVTKPLVYRYDEAGELIPLDPAVPIRASMSGALKDDKGRTLDFGDSEYFEQMPEGSALLSDELMWEVMGPAARDTYDEMYGGTRFARKQLTGGYGTDEVPIQSHDIVPVRRSKVEHVGLIPQDDLPALAVAQMMKHERVGKFQDVVAYGFDRIIGPSIDAIVRKPMAYHQFAQRFIGNRKTMSWMYDPVLMEKMSALSAAGQTWVPPKDLTTWIRTVAATHHDDVRALNWTPEHANAWLRGYSTTELDDVLTHVATRAGHATTPAQKQAQVAVKKMQRLGAKRLQMWSIGGESPQAFIARVEEMFGETQKWTVEALKRKAYKLDTNPLYQQLDEANAWEDIIAARDNFRHVTTTASDAAAEAAIADVVPFLDSHEFKTQFADYGKGLLPFWYAEENFMKRWARGLAQEGPQLIRKAQLTYMGMKHAGIVRTDEAGKDWFVYPGSGLLNDAVHKMLPGLEHEFDIGVMFQSPTDRMLPGMSTQFGTPSFNPLVTIPMEIITARSPELHDMEVSLLGEFSSSRSITEMIIPAHFRNVWDAMFKSEEGYTRYASAQMSAIAHLEARDQGLPANATPDQVQDFMDKVRNHARITVVAQALAGFATPGSPSTVEDDGNDWADKLNGQYLSLVRMLGVEGGTDKFLELNPEATLDDITNPLAYTVARNASVSGAPLPATNAALAWSDENADYLHDFPDAAPWLLPQEYEQGARSQYAYDQQTADGLRRRRSPIEYLRAMKFKEAAGEYFAIGDHYLDQMAAAEENGNVQLVRDLTREKERTQLMYRVAHPMFRAELEKSDGRERRRNILEQMQLVINDPQAPSNDQAVAIRQAMTLFNEHRVIKATLGQRRNTATIENVRQADIDYVDAMGRLVKANPGIMSFWISVLKPESSLS